MLMKEGITCLILQMGMICITRRKYILSIIGTLQQCEISPFIREKFSHQLNNEKPDELIDIRPAFYLLF